jgi:hydroxypyruvate isomerase
VEKKMVQFAANLSMMFNEVDFFDRFTVAREAGFKGVEFLFPYDFDKQDLVDALQSHNLTQVLHNLPPGDWAAGERGIATMPDRVDEFREGVNQAIEYATALGCKQVNCLAGLVPEGADMALVYNTFVSNLSYAAARLGENGIRLLIEPINTRVDMPGFYLSTTAQALGILEAVGSDNLAIQYDIYHMQIMEGNLARTLQNNLSSIEHIQLADNPGRNEPGTGEINYPFLFSFLDKIGYQGWIGCEYKPATTTTDGLGWLAPYLTK